MYIYPWNKKSENYLDILAKDKLLFTKDTLFTQNLGKKYRNLNGSYLGIGRIDKTGESMIGLRDGVGLAPLPSRRKYKKYKLFRF